MLSLRPTFSLSSFTLIKRLFSSSWLCAIRVVSSAYLRLLIFLSAIFIPVCNSSNPGMQEKVKVKLLSHVQLFAMLWTVVLQAPLSMGFSKQEYWSGLPFPSPGDLPNPGIERGSPTLQAVSLPWQGRRHQFNSWLRKFPWRRDRLPMPVSLGFPGGSDGKESTCNEGELGSVPGLGNLLEEEHSTFCV